MRLDTEKASVMGAGAPPWPVIVASPFSSPPPRTLLCARWLTEKLLGVEGEWLAVVEATGWP